MPSPFPGMDPYLENPELWPDVHHGLIEALRDVLAPQVRPRYRVAIEKCTDMNEPECLLLVGRPDVTIVKERSSSYASPPAERPVTVTLPMPEAVRQGSLEIREAKSGAVITVIELLSPTNKRPGEGRHAYEHKRMQRLASSTHLVEVDLLRTGAPMPVLGDAGAKPYRILVSRSEERPEAALYAFGLQDQLPSFTVPLKQGEPEPDVRLQALLADLYDRAGYDLAVDYRVDPVPSLDSNSSAWADALLRAKHLR